MTREEEKRKRREASLPGPRSYTVKLPDGSFAPVNATWAVDGLTLTGRLGEREVSCRFVFGTTKIERPVHIERRVYTDSFFGWRPRLLRDDNGKLLKVPVPYQSTTATLTIDGEAFTGLSVCKPPDMFDRKRGMQLALRHVLKQKAVHAKLGPADYEVLNKLFLTKPPKLGHIKRVEKMLKARGGKKTAAKKSVKR